MPFGTSELVGSFRDGARPTSGRPSHAPESGVHCRNFACPSPFARKMILSRAGIRPICSLLWQPALVRSPKARSNAPSAGLRIGSARGLLASKRGCPSSSTSEPPALPRKPRQSYPVNIYLVPDPPLSPRASRQTKNYRVTKPASPETVL